MGAVAIWKAAMSPAGRFVLAIVAALIFTVSVYSAGYRAASKASQAERYRSERDAALRDLGIARDASKVAREMADRAEIEAAEAREKAEEYARKLPKGGSADLSDDDIRELRNIRKRGAR